MQSAKCKVPACILQQFQFILPLCFFGILTSVSVGFVSVSVSLVAAVIFLHATRDGLLWCSTSFVGRFRTSYPSPPSLDLSCSFNSTCGTVAPTPAATVCCSGSGSRVRMEFNLQTKSFDPYRSAPATGVSQRGCGQTGVRSE